MERLMVPPWDTEDPAVTAAWAALTKPENLLDLEKWGQPNLNGRVREYTDIAIAICRNNRNSNKKIESTSNNRARF